jgi:hypothetical protein
MKLTATNKGREIMIPRAKRIAASYRGAIHEQRCNYQRVCAKLAEAEGGVCTTRPPRDQVGNVVKAGLQVRTGGRARKEISAKPV